GGRRHPRIPGDSPVLMHEDVSAPSAPATRADRRRAAAVVGISALVFLAAAPFATRPQVPVPAFIPIYETALVIVDLVTAALLFAQLLYFRSRALLVLACGYLFTAAVAIAHALTFPGLFAPGGLLGAGTQSTAWLYMFWHGGFPAFVIAYAVLERPPPASVSLSSVSAVTSAVAAVAAAALACVLMATAGHAALPVILRDGQSSTAYTVTVSLVWLACVAALVMLWREPGRTILDLWLLVVLVAWTLDIALAAVLNAKRFDVGFYAGRIYGLLAAS